VFGDNTAASMWVRIDMLDIIDSYAVSSVHPLFPCLRPTMFLTPRFFLIPPRFTLLLFVPLFVCHWALATNPFTQYAVDFPDPNYVTAGRFGAKFGGVEATIVAWADEMASYGPWSIFFFHLRHFTELIGHCRRHQQTRRST
jgi:hypothetical protein